MEIFRIYAEKKDGFDIAAKSCCKDLRDNLNIKELTKVRMLVRYDICGITKEEYEKAKYVIFSEPMQDDVYDECVDLGDAKTFVMEYLPGQYDQRADSAAQCVQVITGKERPVVKTATVYAFLGDVSDEKLEEELINMATQYKMDVNNLKAMLGDAEKEQMKADIAVQEAVTLIAAAAVEA